MITCKFCKVAFRKWWRGSDGKAHTGFAALRAHFDNEHEEEFDAMTAKFEAEERNKLPNEARA
jgi:hypothetical protein